MLQYSDIKSGYRGIRIPKHRDTEASEYRSIKFHYLITGTPDTGVIKPKEILAHEKASLYCRKELKVRRKCCQSRRADKNSQNFNRKISERFRFFHLESNF